MAKMWAGRTSGETDRIADDFNSSIGFDSRMYRQDITGSIAHAKMLAKTGIITDADAAELTKGLETILADLESGRLQIDPSCEDIHMFVEQVLTERIGDTGKKLHTARSRNDQVALDIRMYLRDEEKELIALLKELAEVLADTAEKNCGAVMPGYTHLQRAQPILFSHHILAYAMMILRDISRISDAKERMNLSPIGTEEEIAAMEKEFARQGVTAFSDVFEKPYYPLLRQRIEKTWKQLLAKKEIPPQYLQGAVWCLKREWIH